LDIIVIFVMRMIDKKNGIFCLVECWFRT